MIKTYSFIIDQGKGQTELVTLEDYKALQAVCEKQSDGLSKVLERMRKEPMGFLRSDIFKIVSNSIK